MTLPNWDIVIKHPHDGAYCPCGWYALLPTADADYHALVDALDAHARACAIAQGKPAPKAKADTGQLPLFA